MESPTILPAPSLTSVEATAVAWSLGATAPAIAGTFPADLTAAARVHAENARSPATVRAYAAAWRAFVAWCVGYGVAPLPAAPQTVAHFLVIGAAAPATLASKLAAIAAFHRTAGFASPTEHGIVRAVFAGIRRERGVAPRPKAALVVDELRDVLSAMGGSALADAPADPLAGANEEDAAATRVVARLIDVRDRALLLLGFAGALRRSELVGLDVDDLRFEPEGLVLRLRRSKTNQEGALEEVDVLRGADPATCPVRAVRAWVDVATIAEGPLFRSVDRVGRVGAGRLTARIVAERVKRAVARAGLDPDMYAAHSLRSGFATTAARERKSEHAIMRHGRWKSIIVARRYIRDGARWQEHAAEGIGL